MIETRDEDAVRVVEFSQPERANAVTRDGLEELEGAVGDADTPVVYITGADGVFCAGADLDTVASLDESAAEAFAQLGQRVASTIEETDSVVVAGVDGPARGGGVELALACDVRVATPTASFAEPGVELGIFGAWGGTARLPEVVGQGEAMDLAVSGRAVDAEEALRMGLVSRITDQPRTVADEIAANDPAALPLVKDRIRDQSERAVQEAREAAAFAELTPGAVDTSLHRKD